MIQLFNVSKVYTNGVKALVDVTLSIDKGDFLFLVGPSGAGKSTFVKLLYREELPSKGQLMVSGRSLIRMKRREVAVLRRNIGVVFQDFKLLPQMTVYENVAFAMQVIEASSKDIKKRVPEVLKMVGIASKADVLPDQLSGGEQQRVSIARAIVNNPMVLIADEPTGNLDDKTSWDIMSLLTEINKRGTTVIMATHASGIVDKMRKRVIAIEAGRVVRDEEKGAYSNEA